MLLAIILVLLNTTLVTTEIGYVTLVIDPVAGTVTAKGDGSTAQWFFLSKSTMGLC